MKKITQLLAFFISFSLPAQIPTTTELHSQFDQIGRSQRPSTVPIFDSRYEGVKGSRFTIEKYLAGEIWLTDGRHYTTELKYRFDEIENSIQVQYSDGKELLLFNNYVTKLHLFNKDSIIIYRKDVVEGEKDVHKLYQVLLEGKNYTLIKLPARKIVRIDEKTALTIGRLYDQINLIYHYYFKPNNGVFKEIKLKKKDIIKASPSKKGLLEKLFDTPQYEKDLNEKMLINIFQAIEKE